jgi:hypothetical protein
MLVPIMSRLIPIIILIISCQSIKKPDTLTPLELINRNLNSSITELTILSLQYHTNLRIFPVNQELLIRYLGDTASLVFDKFEELVFELYNDTLFIYYKVFDLYNDIEFIQDTIINNTYNVDVSIKYNKIT